MCFALRRQKVHLLAACPNESPALEPLRSKLAVSPPPLARLKRLHSYGGRTSPEQISAEAAAASLNIFATV